MWHTSTGQRVIRGAEAELIQASVETMVESILDVRWDDEDVGFYAGIELYDNLPWTQKLASIEQVARYLLTETSDPLPLTAINEAVIGAIFENIKQEIECEIEQQFAPLFSFAVDEDLNYLWRGLVLAAKRAVISEAARGGAAIDREAGLARECEDEEAWDGVVEILADQILWDRDYELASAFLDDDPDLATFEKELFGIDQDYFVDLPPDPHEHQLEPLLSSVQRLIRVKPN